MGHRQLALIFGIGTAVLALAIAALRMRLGCGQFGIGLAATAALITLSAISQILIAKKEWELDYKNAFIMLLSTSVLYAFLYAFGYRYVENTFPEALGHGDGYLQFWSLFFVNVAFSVPVNAIAAIFYKKSNPN